MRYFIIGYYYNEQGQQYATVVVKTEMIEHAVYMQRRTLNYKLFKPIEKISEISEKEIMDIRNDNDIYNQVEILVVPQDYIDYCKETAVSQSLKSYVIGYFTNQFGSKKVCVIAYADNAFEAIEKQRDLAVQFNKYSEHYDVLHFNGDNNFYIVSEDDINIIEKEYIIERIKIK